jgi:hypothetical protein
VSEKVTENVSENVSEKIPVSGHSVGLGAGWASPGLWHSAAAKLKKGEKIN